MGHLKKNIRRKLTESGKLIDANPYHVLLINGEEILKNNNGQYVLISIDVKEFKMINESLGYVYGSEILVQMFQKLKAFIKEAGEVFRRCDDQFIILWIEKRKDHLKEMIQKLCQEMSMILLEDGRKVEINLAVGIYEIPEDEKNMTACLSRVDSARLMAKKDANKQYAFYDQECMKQCYRLKMLEKQLREAIVEERFEIYFQPKIHLSSQKIKGAEALVRWQEGMQLGIGPDVFIPILESIGLIKQLDRWVLEQVCQVIKKWKDEHMPLYPIAVNLSKLYLEDKPFIQSMLQIIEAYGIESKWVEFEITESINLGEASKLVEMIHYLKGHGFTIAMDDFGSGYSSLNVLKDLPIDILKLDKGFIQDSQLTVKSEVIITCMVEMAHKIGLQVIAEGVESKAQVDFLRGIACDCAQGFFYAKPMAIEGYETYVTRQSHSS